MVSFDIPTYVNMQEKKTNQSEASISLGHGIEYTKFTSVEEALLYIEIYVFDMAAEISITGTDAINDISIICPADIAQSCRRLAPIVPRIPYSVELLSVQFVINDAIIIAAIIMTGIEINII